MSNLFDGPTPPKLKAITINGAVIVESEEEAKKKAEKRKERRSRWDQTSRNTAPNLKGAKKNTTTNSIFNECTPILALPPPGGIKDNPAALRNLNMALPATLDASKMDEKSQQIYLLQMTIHESTRNLARPDLGIPANPRDRSPSPEPIYNSSGIRINTRMERTRQKWINQRNNAITKLKELDPHYQPPSQYKYKNVKLEDKVFLPADENPTINFVGLLLGPRGNYLEKLKEETKCNIVIRGKGSLRSGMTGIKKDGSVVDGLEEPLHALITASTAEDVQRGVNKIKNIVEMQVYNPECEQAVALRAQHMHELAVLNGTLKEVDMKCLNCGRLGHKTWQCDERPNFTSAVICSSCGGVGHLTKDCNQRRPGAVWVTKKEKDPAKIDKEYEAFVEDMMGYDPNKSSKSTEKPYVPPMGDLSKSLTPTSRPLMLTHKFSNSIGSSAPGAASAEMRAMSDPQKAGGLRVIGKSIFGGKLTTMTSGYKSQAELDYEREKKKQENAFRPVPTEWRVEQLEKNLNAESEQYMKHLEYVRQQELKIKADEIKRKLNLPPPPPPPPSSSIPFPAAAAKQSGCPPPSSVPFPAAAAKQSGCPPPAPVVPAAATPAPLMSIKTYAAPSTSAAPVKTLKLGPESKLKKVKPLYSQFVKAKKSDTDNMDNLPNLNIGNPWEKYAKK